MRTILIYLLRDPRNSQVKYVGKTVQKIRDRLTTHIREAKRNDKSPKDKWILEVISNDFEPIIEIIEQAQEENWQERERYWIVEYYNQGCELTNRTDGGEGLHGHKFSKEHRKKLSKVLVGNKRALGYKHPKEFGQEISKRMTGEDNPNYGKDFSRKYREKLSNAQKGRKHSEETKVKMRKAAIERSENPEYIKKLSNAASNRSPEVRKRMGDAIRTAKRLNKI